MARVSAVIVKDGKVLLIHRKKEGKEYWVFPGGGIEEGESPEEAVKREVKEETSLDVTKVTGSHPVFKCEVSEGELVLGGPEIERNSERNWYRPEWVDLIKAQEINLYPEEGKRVLKEII